MRRKMGYNKRSPRSQAIVGGKERADQMSDYSDLPEDDEARPIRSRSSRKRNSKSKSKSIRFGGEVDADFEREEKDTPPTRSGSRPHKSRVAFNDEPKISFGQPPIKSALAGGADHKSTPALKLHQTDKARGPASRSRSRSIGTGLRSAGARGHSGSGARNFPEPKYGIGGQGTDSRREAFEAKFDKYRSNKHTIEKRAKVME